MAPPQRIHHPPFKIHCPIQGCRKGLRSQSGLTQHIQALHRDLPPAGLQPQTEPYALSSVELDDHLSLPPPDDLNVPDTPHPSHFHDAGDWETFGSVASSTETSGPPLASSCRTSPSLHDEELPRGKSTEYHPLINGRP